MAKIKKLTLDGTTIYPATIMEAVKNRATNKTLAAELLTLAKAVNSGATTPDAALSALTALGTGYNSVVAVATTLKDFLTNATDSDTVINKWKEIEAFLSGITETQNLTGLLQQNLNSAKSYTDAELEDIVSGIIIPGNEFEELDKYVGFAKESGKYIGGYGWFALKYAGNIVGLMSVTTDTMLHEIHQTVLGNFHVENGKLSSSHTDGQFSVYTRIFNLSAANNPNPQLTWSEWKRNRIDNIGVPSSSSFAGTVWGEIEKLYNAATQSANGLMSAADKKKLDAFGAATTYLTAAACNDVTDYPEITI